MSKLIHLIAWFMLGCITSSFIAWLGAVHPALFKVAMLIYGLVAIFLACSVILDDAIRTFFKVEHDYYYGLIIAIAAATIIGGVVTIL